MLHSIDHPKALLFIVQELAAIERKLEGTNSYSHFLSSVKDEWHRAQEDGQPMSSASRDLLLQHWQNEDNDKHLRSQAFSLWAATIDEGDLEILRAAVPPQSMADSILIARLIRGDTQAIAAMIGKINTAEPNNSFCWWQYGRYIWSPELTDALDGFLDRLGNMANRLWGESFNADWITQEMIIRLPTDDAERLLLKHWDHLRFRSHFVQAALYVSTPRLLEAARETIRECPQPAELIKSLSSRFGIRTKNHPGLTHESQVLVLEPYMDYLSKHDLYTLWMACNDHGWFTTRQRLLDSRLQSPFLERVWDHDRVILELDKKVAEKYPLWMIHRWLDDFVKTGVSENQIFETLMAWLDARQSIEALEIIASTVRQRGTRENLLALKIYDGMPKNVAKQITADTKFMVYRRTLR